MMYYDNSVTKLFIQMSGEELRKLLLDNNYILAGIAKSMAITPQDLNSKLKAKSLKAEFIDKVEAVINTSIDNLRKHGMSANEPSVAYKPRNEAFDLGAWSHEGPKEVHRGKEYIDLGNGNYLLYVPMVPHIATMGYLSGYSDPTWLEELPKHVITTTHIPFGEYRTFIARGMSMYDGTARSIQENSKITGRIIRQDLYRDSKLHLHRYQLFIIVHKEGIMIKEITKHDVENRIISIHSWNPDKKQYPDQDIELKDVLQILNVIKIERDI